MKTQSKWTPGPWVFSGPNSMEVTGYRGQHQDIPQVVAKVHGYWDGEAEANAHLIATAPELAEALTEVASLSIPQATAVKETWIARGQEWVGIINKARSLLAKLEG